MSVTSQLSHVIHGSASCKYSIDFLWTTCQVTLPLRVDYFHFHPASLSTETAERVGGAVTWAVHTDAPQQLMTCSDHYAGYPCCMRNIKGMTQYCHHVDIWIASRANVQWLAGRKVEIKHWMTEWTVLQVYMLGAVSKLQGNDQKRFTWSE